MDFLQIPERSGKPRSSGLTLVRDPGMGVHQVESFVESAGQYVDYVKFRNLTPRLHSEESLKQKIAIYQQADVPVFAGGIYIEMAFLQGVLDKALDYLREMKFDAVELSDNIVPFSIEQKLDIVRKCTDRGVTVLCEVGQKWPDKPFDVLGMAADIETLKEAGVSKVIIEEGEIDRMITGKGNTAETSKLFDLVERVGQDCLIFEAVRSDQQSMLIKNLGADVNIGPNVAPEEVLWLEPMRRGLGRSVGYFCMEPWMKKAQLAAS
jgi:phosphosulfolactate synthase